VWFVLVATVVGAIIAAAVATLAPAGYTARVTVLVAPAPKETPITRDDLSIAQAYIPTLAELTTIRPVLDRALQATGVTMTSEQLALNVTSHVPADTNLLTISVSNPNPAKAAALANAIARQLPTYASSTSGPDSGVRLVLTVVDPATPPEIRDGPILPVRIALGGAIAFFLTVSIAFLVENVGRGAQSLGRGVDERARRPLAPQPAAPAAYPMTRAAVAPPTYQATAVSSQRTAPPPPPVLAPAAQPLAPRPPAPAVSTQIPGVLQPTSVKTESASGASGAGGTGGTGGATGPDRAPSPASGQVYSPTFSRTSSATGGKRAFTPPFARAAEIAQARPGPARDRSGRFTSGRRTDRDSASS